MKFLFNPQGPILVFISKYLINFFLATTRSENPVESEINQLIEKNLLEAQSTMDLNVALDSIVEKLKVPILEDIEKSLFVKFLTFVARVENRTRLSRKIFLMDESLARLAKFYMRENIEDSWLTEHLLMQPNSLIFSLWNTDVRIDFLLTKQITHLRSFWQLFNLKINFSEFIRNSDKDLLGRRVDFLVNLDFENFLIVILLSVQELMINKKFSQVNYLFKIDQIKNLPENGYLWVQTSVMI